ncbi:hypothetical protein [Spongiibacter sp.]|uniref:hypothetical protein n=1 Tax=Spongiibacter sp. TaxID=2024860 RepID=UPI0035625508
MIDANDYALAWQVYLGTGLAASLFWVLLIRAYRLTALKLWASLAVISLLLLPCRHPEAMELWMPATIGAALSLMTGGLESAMEAMIIVAAGQIMAVVIALTWRLTRPRRRAGAEQPQAQAPSDKRIEPKFGGQ